MGRSARSCFPTPQKHPPSPPQHHLLSHTSNPCARGSSALHALFENRPQQNQHPAPPRLRKKDSTQLPIAENGLVVRQLVVDGFGPPSRSGYCVVFVQRSSVRQRSSPTVREGPIAKTEFHQMRCEGLLATVVRNAGQEKGDGGIRGIHTHRPMRRSEARSPSIRAPRAVAAAEPWAEPSGFAEF